MKTGKNILFGALISGVLVFCGWSGLMAADPDAKNDINVETAPDARPPDASRTVVKNPYGFLEYDGTGYHVVTRDPKADRASHVRLKPLGTNEEGTVYILEVIGQKEKRDEEPGVMGQQGPRIAVQRVEDLDKRKGVDPAPKKEHRADVGVGMKVSGSSEVMLGRGVVVERSNEKGGLESRDDGWRFRFKTNF